MATPVYDKMIKAELIEELENRGLFGYTEENSRALLVTTLENDDEYGSRDSYEPFVKTPKFHQVEEG